jgi:hypothetical protein
LLDQLGLFPLGQDHQGQPACLYFDRHLDLDSGCRLLDKVALEVVFAVGEKDLRDVVLVQVFTRHSEHVPTLARVRLDRFHGRHDGLSAHPGRKYERYEENGDDKRRLHLKKSSTKMLVPIAGECKPE